MLATLVLAAAMASAPPQPPAPRDLVPGATYDGRIPTLTAAVGHDFGARISTPEQIAAYLQALHQAAPERTRLVPYAVSWEGRPLHVLMIGSADRLARLDEVRAGLRRLADPRGLPPAEAERLVASLPVVVWLMHAVHGNEISSSDAALAEAYHLLAARGDARVDTILREALVLVDPLQNPDGRARFIATNQQGQGPAPDPDPAAVERDEPWPGGRPNHYLFDMNRDWLALSQVETRGRARLGLEWNPQVVVDLHEMSGEATYYFAPPAEPANPYITPTQRQWLTAFGRENARAFDARGFAYFVREVFDAYYPGYGDSWPMFQGAISMTYEQASTRGLAYRRDDESILTYRDGVVRHFTAALTTLDTAARNRERLLRDYLEYRRSAVAEGERAAVREYLVPPGPDAARAEAFGRALADHGIEVRRLEQPVSVGTRTLPAGTLAVSSAQPMSRLLRNLMESDIRMDETFLKEQARRRQKRLGDQIYDVTAWSLPLLYDIEVVGSDRPVTVPSVPFAPRVREGQAPALPGAKAAYLLPWGTGAAGATVEALQRGLRVYSAGRSFTIAGRVYDVGTAIIRTAEHGPDLPATLGAIAARWGADVVPLDSTWVDEGMSLGSSDAALLKTPRVLMAWDAPVSSQSAGWARFWLERQFGQPVTAVRTASLRYVDLRRYNVLVLPSGTYGLFGDEDVRRLKDWIAAGGVLVTLADASRWAAGEKVGLLAAKLESRDGAAAASAAAGGDKKADEKKAFDYEKAIQPDKEDPEAVPGALLRVTLDREHWLAAGLDGEVQAIVEGVRIFTPVKLDRGRNVGIYATKDRLVAGGYAWEASQNQLPQKAYLMHQPLGRGHVIAFAEDPNFRAAAPATGLLFVNAVVLGPGR